MNYAEKLSPATEPGFVLDHTDLWHVCVVVPDVEAAMADLSARFGYTWLPVARQRFKADVPGIEPVWQEASITFTREGPIHLELGQMGEGPIRAETGPDEPYHCGYWCDDVPASRDGLVANGWSLDWEIRVGEDGPFVASLHSPSGYGVELVPRSSRASFQSKLAG
jgi:hypothetical protein